MTTPLKIDLPLVAGGTVPLARFAGGLFAAFVLNDGRPLDEESLEHLGAEVLQNRHLIMAVIDVIAGLSKVHPEFTPRMMELAAAWRAAPVGNMG